MRQQITRWVLALLILACGGALGTESYAVASVLADGGGGAPEESSIGRDDALKEFGAARSDHSSIVLSIGQCYFKDTGDPVHWSPSVLVNLLLKLDEHLKDTLLHDLSHNSDSLPKAIPVLNAFHAAAISFSDRISRDRLQFWRELEDSRSRSRLYQILILGLGAGATVFVSIRSILQGNNGWSGTIGVLAIVLSAAGAAVSSMNSFEGSQATAQRDQRALSQLQQLHWRIASDVLRRPELCSDTSASPGKAMEVVDAWRTRLESILDSAVESISKPGDISSGSATDEGVKAKSPKGDSEATILPAASG